MAQTVLDHDNKIEYLHTMLQDQQRTMAALVALLEQRGPSSAPQQTAPWNLKDATPKQRRAILEQLFVWIDWYNENYPGVEEDVIPACWFRHSAVVHELVAVLVAWQAAYRSDEDPSDAPAYWHERILHPIITRLSRDKAAGWGNCLTAHREPHQPTNIGSEHDSFQAWLAESNSAQDSEGYPANHG